ncbi:FxsA family protein [Lapillicoccus jejuensis]|uniref:UPF0716 protein FxsA n=1 Tax=Lapillicoccus jejuensis TaxID=402171 RepID=A0A542E4T8_9MICO|nr:FxsA family protein [Lapillicoccus jejuensis]TQJ10358.1 UPF0716 protein FxsA [Lapillicoccus jejuensis]
MAPPVGEPRRPGGRRGGAFRLLRLLLVLVPVVEVALVIAVAHLIGGWPTFLLLLAGSALGAWLVRREGARTLRSMSAAVRTGGLPVQELSDAALVLAGGVLILVPGFLTDLVGLLLVLPPTRPLARRVVAALTARRLLGAVTVNGQVVDGQVVDGQVVGRPDGATTPRDRGPGDPPDVIEGRVL